MILTDLPQTKSKKFSFKKLVFFSYLSLILVNNSNVISEPLTIQRPDKEFKISNVSFITEAVKKTGASVVTIESQRFVKNKQYYGDSRIFLDPYFERFFGLELPYGNQQKLEQSQGSGFIFADGLVMTNAHVVNGSKKLIVGLSNGAKYEGKLIGQDLLTDIAVIKLQGKGPWPKATLGDSTKIAVGDWAIAVGNPF